MISDRAFRAAQLAYDLRDDELPLCRYCHADRGERCRKHPECSRWEREPCDGCIYAATRPENKCSFCDEKEKPE